jgi:hypothetical protein
MQTKLRISLGGTLILLSIYLGLVGSEILAFLNTTTTSLTGLPIVSAFFLGLALVFGFIGFYMVSAIVSNKGN